MHDCLNYDLVSYTPGSFPGSLLATKASPTEEAKSIFERHRNRQHTRRHTVYIRLKEDSILSSIQIRVLSEAHTSVNEVLNADFTFYVGKDNSTVKQLVELFHETTPWSASWIFRHHDASFAEDQVLTPINCLVIESDICGHAIDNGSMQLE